MSKIQIITYVYLLIINSSMVLGQSQWTATNGNGNGYSQLIKHGNDYYAASSDGISYSNDGGNNWILLNNGLLNTNVKSIAFSGSNIFAGTNGGGVFYSNDNGANWIPRNSGLPSNLVVYSVVTSGINVIIGTYHHGFYASNDNGLTWSNNVINTILGTANPLSITSMCSEGNNVYAIGTYGMFFESNDAGITWHVFSTINSYNSINSVSVSGGNIYVCDTYGGLYKYQSGNFVFIHSGTLVVSDSNSICTYKAISNSADLGLYRSSDNGNNFTFLNSGIDTYNNETVTSILVDNNVIMASTSFNRIYRSIDNGLNWSIVNANIYYSTSINNYQSRAINSFYTKNSTLYACSGGGLFASNNLGKSWSLKNQMKIDNLVSSVNNFYAAKSGGGVYKSTDNCINFSQIEYFSDNDPNSIGVLGSTIISSKSISYDSGVNWNWIGGHFNTISVCGSNIFADGSLSSDNGLTWQTIGNPPIYVSYSNNSSLLFTGRYSNDCGNTVSFFPSYPPAMTTSLSMNGTTIFAGTSSAGIFYSTNFGTTWSAWNEGLPVPYDEIRAISINDGKMFISYNLKGVWSRSLSNVLSTNEVNENSDFVQIYPNPTNSKITINLSNSTYSIGGKIIIINSLGQQIFSSKINQQIEEIPVSSIFSSGLYFVKLIDIHGNEFSTKKIIVN